MDEERDTDCKEPAEQIKKIGRLSSASGNHGSAALLDMLGTCSQSYTEDMMHENIHDVFQAEATSLFGKQHSCLIDGVVHNLHMMTSDIEHLEVNDEIRGLFDYIGAYKVQEIELATILKPFIPDYILAVGAIDEFIKVPRPDNQPDYLGLKVDVDISNFFYLLIVNLSFLNNLKVEYMKYRLGMREPMGIGLHDVLDESGTKQSDPAVLTLQLRAASNQTNLHQLKISSVEYADKNPRKLDAWINSIKELYQTRPPPSVIYSKQMPDIENLMQEWPTSIQNVLDEIQLPTAKLDVDLVTFIDICCSILDIPVYKSRLESLHVMFLLYLELQNSAEQEFSCAASDWVSNNSISAY